MSGEQDRGEQQQAVGQRQGTEAVRDAQQVESGHGHAHRHPSHHAHCAAKDEIRQQRHHDDVERGDESGAAGRTAELSNNEKLFIDLLSIINSLDRQFGKRATIKLLTQQFGYSYDRAVDYYDQADQLFYSNRNTTKEALRNKYAEMLDNIAHAALAAAQTPKDYEAVSEIIAKAAKIRKLDEPEIQKLPAAMYLRQIRMFSLTPEVLGLPPVNRQEVNEQIQQLHIPEVEKRRLRQEALIEDVDIIEMFENGKACEN